VSAGTIALSVYAAGVLIAVIRVDGSFATRIGLGLVWPLGLLAFVVTITVLLCVAAVAFPIFGVVLAAAIIGAWYLI
jgi:hypothetical protein